MPMQQLNPLPEAPTGYMMIAGWPKMLVHPCNVLVYAEPAVDTSRTAGCMGCKFLWSQLT